MVDSAKSKALQDEVDKMPAVTWCDSAAAQPAGGDYICLLRATLTGNPYRLPTPRSYTWDN
ncbi:hypothetical protein PGTUg99_003869 [Puccinia graminis f. sp. tritici]|uniref:Uncharacterized protein n=1 Tax=Puccinia graminis f. sp. tritici TaxID=56615 RepID=A0A5B0N6R9_PUCGR|nr:hypothetical protein PGTUg99_003869 [Puccinia graminis f. sp. tritici]